MQLLGNIKIATERIGRRFMFAFEKKILDYMEKHLDLVIFVMVTIGGFLIRASLRHYISKDAASDLLPWYSQIEGNGGFQGLGKQVGTYNMFYQFLIAIMTYLPIKPLYAYKILSCVFDYLLAGAAAWFAYSFPKENDSNEKRKWNSITVYSLIIFSPVVILNSAQWAQCDSIYVFFVLMAFALFCKEKYLLSFVFYGIAAAFKLQAVFLLPFLLFIYFVKRSFSILYFLAAPISMCIVNIPCLIMGRRMSEIFSLYLDQTNEYSAISMNYPSFWLLLKDVPVDGQVELYKDAAILFTICVLAGWMISWIVNRIQLSGRNMLYMAFILTFTCVLFLPTMHERYGYIYEILGVLILFFNKKTLPLLLSLNGISLMTYGFYLNDRIINLGTLAVINFAIYVFYGFILTKQIMEDKNKITMES